MEPNWGVLLLYYATCSFAQFATPGENHSQTKGFLFPGTASAAVKVECDATARGSAPKLDYGGWMCERCE